MSARAPFLVLPPPASLANLLRDLFGRAVTAKKAAGPFPAGPRVVGAYTRDDGTLSAVCALDLQLSAHLGAALTMLPAGVAEEAIKAGALSPALLESVHEVLNVASRWFNQPKAPRVVLKEVHVAALPPPVEALVQKPPKTTDVELTIQGYKGGRLALFSL